MAPLLIPPETKCPSLWCTSGISLDLTPGEDFILLDCFKVHLWRFILAQIGSVFSNQTVWNVADRNPMNRADVIPCSNREACLCSITYCISV
jgi:hypothetical protein